MKYSRRALMLTVGVGMLTTAAGARSVPAPRPAPPYAYLKHNSYSLEEVIRQVDRNPQLQKRYAKHFNIPEGQVVAYFREHLVESYIPSTKAYPVWCVKPDGTRFVVNQTFRAGTRVLSLRNGEPVLKWACGNPLSRKLPEIKKKQVVRKSKVLPREQVRRRTFDVVTPFETPRDLVAQAPPYEVPPSDMITFRKPQPPKPQVRIPWGIVPGIILTGTLGGGGGTQTPPPPPIPEPGTLGLLGIAAVTVMSARRFLKP